MNKRTLYIETESLVLTFLCHGTLHLPYFCVPLSAYPLCMPLITWRPYSRVYCCLVFDFYVLTCLAYLFNSVEDSWAWELRHYSSDMCFHSSEWESTSRIGSFHNNSFCKFCQENCSVEQSAIFIFFSLPLGRGSVFFCKLLLLKILLHNLTFPKSPCWFMQLTFLFFSAWYQVTFQSAVVIW